MLTVAGLLRLLDAPQPLTVEGLPVDPLLVVDLATADGHVRAETLEAGLGMLPQVTVGVLPSDPSPQALLLAQACTFTLRQASGQRSGPGVRGRRACVVVDDVDAELAAVERSIQHAPVAAVSLHRLLRLQARSTVPDGLVAESAVYSTLLAGPEFARWLAGRPSRRPAGTGEPLDVTAEAGILRITLSRPARRNAYSAAMREALMDALSVAAADPSLRVELRGRGPDFCAGGDLDEFGTALDPARAHVLRTARSAGLALHRLGARTTAYLQGNCIGAGIELPAFADRVLARDDTLIRLPELAMGLVPGAGGTVSVTRRIGRWRTAWLALTGAPLTVRTALSWGLVDEVVP